MKSRLLIAAATLAALVACAKKAETAEKAAAPDEAAEAAAGYGADANEADKAKAAAGLARAEKFLAENAKKPGVKTTASGLQYEMLSEGPEGGLTPTEADIVSVHYVGTLVDGVEFDSSRARGAAARFKVGQVIEGWIEGLQLLTEGDRARLFVPPALAYGETGTPGGPIGPNEALIFDVELLKVQNPASNLAASTAFLSANAKKPGVKTTPSGLQYQVISEGPAAGKKPTDANLVKVHYEGRLIGGEIFDSSIARGEPAEFPLAQVIRGWTEGVQLMTEGDKFRFFIPAALGYGEAGTPDGSIGPNEALIFDVELIAVTG